MSATIPNSMLLSDLLKATGYDCPDDLQGKTFNQATSGGEADLEANHASSVNVEEYTQPIEITPAEGKDGMEKVTLTLTNIPQEADIEDNKAQTINVSTYTEPVEITPTEGKDGMKKATVTLTNIPSSGASAYAWKLTIGGNDAGYRYFDFAEAPADKTTANTHKALRVYNTTQLEVEQNAFETYIKTDATHFSFEADGDEYVATRDSAKDITLWG